MCRKEDGVHPLPLTLVMTTDSKNSEKYVATANTQDRHPNLGNYVGREKSYWTKSPAKISLQMFSDWSPNQHIKSLQ